MSKKSILGSVTMVAALTVLLAACGSKSNSSSSSSSSTKQQTFPLATTNKKAAVKGATLNIAVVDDSPFKGVFNEELYDDAYDADFMTPAAESLFGTTSGFKFNDKGAASIKFDNDKKTATIEIKKNVKWSDGKPVTAKDIEYAYEIVANKDTSTSRYTGSLQNIEGLSEYHDGKSKTISGVEMPDGADGQKVILHFKQMKPGFTQSGNGYFLESAAPYHYLKSVPFKKLASSDQVRKSPLFFGPYVMSKIVPGQSVAYTANKYYWKGEPKTKKLTASVVSTSSIVSGLKNKKYDIAMEMPTDNYSSYKNVKGYKILGKEDLSYTYIGFHVGKWDAKKGVNVMDKNAKMNNKSLRQAMSYALNLDEINNKFYPGLRSTGTTLIPPVFKEFHDSSLKGYPLNIKKANKLLDDAGYKKGKDGYRTDPNGKKLTIRFASMAGGDSATAIAQDYIQQWKKIGLRVKLTSGRLLEFQNFYDKIQNDTNDYDVFQAAWSLSSEPSPADLFSEQAPYNFSRFVSKKHNKLIADIDSEASLNADHRKKAFYAWQKWMMDQDYVEPVQYRTNVTPVSNRVKNFTIQWGSSPWNEVELTAKD
ncbi:oligopeptide ABC transporter substrate-binding protein [Lacticaseibacillus nasuensis]|nr:oligopeptide ABC transporter substrate-binding protein [Lacticaseibacillus nasuensis]